MLPRAAACCGCRRSSHALEALLLALLLVRRPRRRRRGRTWTRTPAHSTRGPHTRCPRRGGGGGGLTLRVALWEMLYRIGSITRAPLPLAQGARALFARTLTL
eukprot:2383475-Pyramimonas_sp.AAC.1